MRILLQTSIPYVHDDWNVGRFSLLAAQLRCFADVTTRDRQADESGNDPLLVDLSRDRFDEVWLFGVDGGVALSEARASDPRARTVARGRSLATGREFDLLVAFDRTASQPGRAIAQSSFHHFADYNWSPELGAPSFVTEPAGDEVYRYPERMNHIRAYVRNAAEWLAPDRA